MVVRGTALFGVGERTERLTTGDALVFQPGQDHVLLEASPDLELFVLALRPELTDRVLGIAALASSRSAHFAKRELASVANELGSLEHVNDPMAAETRTANVFLRAIEHRDSYHVVSRRALEETHGDATLAATSVAALARVSPSTLSSRFHHDLGLPLVEYRARLKLMRFVELVDAGVTQTSAAFEAGFGSYAQCHRVFRRALGCAPRLYFEGERERLNDALFGSPGVTGAACT